MRKRLWIVLTLTLAIVGYLIAQQNAGTGVDAVSNTAMSFQQVPGDGTLRIPACALYYFNGTTWDRARGTTTGTITGQNFNGTDGFTNNLFAPNNASGVTELQTAVMYGFNGSTYDRSRTASAANLTSTSLGSTLSEKGGRWQVVSTPAVSTRASASQAAGGAGVRHVADCVTFSAGSTTAPVLTKLNVSLRDGASGAGTIIGSWTVVIPAATGQNVAPFSSCGLALVGTANTAMTLEFSALLTNLFQDVTLTGYDVN